jgi:hypothetical protein
MSTPSNCRISVDTVSNRFFFYTTDSGGQIYCFDIHDYDEGYTTNGGWHGVHGSGGLSDTVSGGSWGTALTNGTLNGVSYTARTGWMYFTEYSNTAYIEGRCREKASLSSSDPGSTEWAYSSSYQNYLYANQETPIPTVGYNIDSTENYVYPVISNNGGYEYSVQYQLNSSTWTACSDSYNVSLADAVGGYVRFRARTEWSSTNYSDWGYSSYCYVCPEVSSISISSPNSSNVITATAPSYTNYTIYYDRSVNGSTYTGNYNSYDLDNFGSSSGYLNFRARYMRSGYISPGRDSDWGWGYSGTYYYYPRPDPPVFSVGSITSNSARISWSWDSAAVRIYLYIIRDRDGYQVATYNTSTKTTTSYSTSALVQGETYYVYGYFTGSGDDSFFSDYVYFSTLTLPDPPVMWIASGYPTNNAVKIEFNWGAYAYKTSIDIMTTDDYGDTVGVVSWSTTSKSVTSYTYSSLQPDKMYYVYGNSWLSNGEMGESNAYIEFATLPDIPNAPAVTCSNTSGLTYQFTCQRDGTASTVHISIKDSTGTYVVNDYQDTLLSFSASFTMAKYRENHTWEVWASNAANSSAKVTGSFTTPYSAKPSLYPSSYMNYYQGDAMQWYDVAKTKVIVCTAIEWNALKSRINEIRVYNGGYGTGTNYSFSYSDVSSGQTLTANLYNDIVGAFNIIGLYPSQVSSGQKITAYHFTQLKDLINSKINSL